MPKEYIIPNRGCWFQVKGSFQLPSREWIAAGAKGWCYDTDPVENTITLVISGQYVTLERDACGRYNPCGMPDREAAASPNAQPMRLDVEN